MRRERSSNAGLKVLIFIFLIAFVGTGIYALRLYRSSEKIKTTLEREKTNLIESLEDLQEDYDFLSTEFENSSSELKRTKAEIEMYIDSLKSSKVDASMISRYRSQLAVLKREREYLLEQNDSLLYSVRIMEMERDSTMSQLRTQISINESLENKSIELEKKMQERAGLNITKVIVDGVRERSNGKLSITRKAVKVNMIRICYTVEKNPLADTGDVNFYIKVTQPNGNLLGANKTMSNEFGRSIEYSIISNFYYNNETSLDVCDYVNVEEGDKFVAGIYNISIYDQDLRTVGDLKIILK